jgi:thiamine transporter
MRSNQHTKMLVEAGIMIALAMVLNMFTVFKMPFGGSVTAGSMVPILIFAIRWGVMPGLLVGAVFGSLQAMFGGYVISLMQGLLDYPIAFAFLGLGGLFAKRGEFSFVGLVAGVAVASVGRFFAHVLSGVVFFGEYADVGQNVWEYSLVYNAGYMGAELIVTLLVTIGISSALKRYLIIQAS